MNRLIFVLLVAAACATPLPDVESQATDLTDGTPAAYGVLAFVNSSAATEQTLDVQVGLDARAAKGIVAVTAVRQITSIAELDAIPYVGPSALAKLQAYATQIGLIPAYLVDGVAFTSAQAATVLAAVNGATDAELDTAAKLDSRAASNIVAARPIANLTALAAIPYVGASALTKLEAWAPTWSCTPALTLRTDDADVNDWNALLVVATPSEFGPWANIFAFRATSCTSAASLAGLVQTAMATRWAASDGASRTLVDPVTSGASAYVSLIAETHSAIEGSIGDGTWDPMGNVTWANATQIVAALQAVSPSSIEVSLATEQEECSEHAIGLFDPTTGLVFIVHRFTRC